MGELLSFPGLGLEFHLDRVAFHIGSYTIAWYGILMALAFLVGISYVMLRTKTFGLDGDRVIDVLLVAVMGGIVGARIYYVAFSWNEYKDNLADIFKIWEGGIAIYGGLIGAILVGLWMCRVRKVRVLPMLDIATGGVIIGQAIGRWGNFVNIEAFGSNTTMPWGMTSPVIERYLTAHQQELAEVGVIVDPSMPVHPTFFYESIWCLLGFILIAWYTKRRRFDGELVLFYCVWYGAERAVVEGLRTDSLMWGNFRVSQVLSIIGVVVALALWIWIRVKIKRANDPEYLKLYVNTEEAEMIRQGTFYPKKETAKGESAAEETSAGAPAPETINDDERKEENSDGSDT
ncbi:prolipoprotein diacylglyceryl transferase [Clostridiaceae bacterium NSJ-31]|uniref:Phosphatidylglycerol--prolipoprotein diacylglyceryl transferase n=1 Tax=Ligaoa zhengdingensis TaxID=2763658 RepID=A0A926DXR3_9FIRM|nr:prolipoprotein diacylglyceryl transferase [Ligaoa zhengdingensis]MBC8545542.1 prolipoprotein diacylglyceryl transferase [Ligaoa zhengdingensis]